MIALGGGKFHVVGWKHGLPGSSEKVEKTVEGDGARKGDKIVFSGSKWKADIDAAGMLTATNHENRTWKLKRVIRTSPTLGAKPPAGADGRRLHRAAAAGRPTAAKAAIMAVERRKERRVNAAPAGALGEGNGSFMAWVRREWNARAAAGRTRLRL